MNNKRGQAAAVLLAIIMGLIIVFIILMPPDKRAELLGEKSSQTTVLNNLDQEPPKRFVKETLLQETPGRLSYLQEGDVEKLVPSTHIFTETASEILAERDSLTVKKSLFSSQTENLQFKLKNLDLTKNLYLDFSIQQYEGKLIILLNNQEIFNRETNKIQPLKLPKDLFENDNVLTFQVSSPGIAFWSTNQYELHNVKVVADITDITGRQAKHLIHVNSDESQNIEEVSLRYSLSCVPEKMGKLKVRLNDHLVFSGVPENCEDIFYHTLSPAIIATGDNWLIFETDEGDYDLSHIALKIKLEKPSYPTYYFELDQDYFTESEDSAQCGKADGTCPRGCDEDADPDCCFDAYTTPFWCDASTSNSDDRCVDFVDAENCNRCSSGYEDEDQDPPEACTELCGDDTDDYCPPDCSSDYDKDCCFAEDGNQFWCDSLPTSGLDFTCVDSLSRDECQVCSSNYEGGTDTPDCPEPDTETEESLMENYDVILTLAFPDDEKKEAEIYINGHKISFDTYKIEFSRSLDQYVKPWTNSIKVVPKNSFDVSEISVELKG